MLFTESGKSVFGEFFIFFNRKFKTKFRLNLFFIKLLLLKKSNKTTKSIKKYKIDNPKNKDYNKFVMK